MTERRHSRGLDDAGSASVWVLTASVLVLLVAVVASARAATVVVRHRAESAADLAALAGAARIGVDGAICPAARAITAANDARLVSCRTRLTPDLRSGTIVVRVSVHVHLPFAGTRTVTASARAGRLVGSTR